MEYSGLIPCSETQERKLIILLIIMLLTHSSSKRNNTIDSVKKMQKRLISYTSAKVSFLAELPVMEQFLK
jgi:hypothetical protein